ncbi:TPA: autotransporter outer membrane beta-barrel domain-containing protein, partial [Escherichia coli]|nr:autotransporter outer membrane beta-barrel domain-containing protein [Escherichia coli]
TPAPTPAKRITPSTAAVLSMASTAPVINRQEIDVVRTHLINAKGEGNVWGIYSNGRDRLSTDAGAALSMRTDGLTIGIERNDKARNDATLTSGLFASFQNSKVDFNRGGEGRVKTSSFGGYADWHMNSWYVSGIAKFSYLENDVNARMTSGVRASGRYNQTALSADLQTGYKFNITDNTWITPFAGTSVFSANGAEYGLSNGMKAEVKSVRSVISETGAIVGYSGKVVSPWVKLAAGREFINNNQVQVNADKFINDASGSYYSLQGGVTGELSQNMRISADVKYRDGSKTESPVTANIGLSYSFK